MFIVIWLYNVHITRVAWTVTCPPPISMTSHVTWESRRFAQSIIKLHLGTCNVFHLTNKQTKMDSLSCTTVENDALHFSFLTFKNSSQQLCHRNSDTQFGNNCDHFKSYKFFKSNNIYMLHEHNIRGHLIGISHIVLPSRHGAASWSLTSRIYVVFLRRIGGLARR